MKKTLIFLALIAFTVIAKGQNPNRAEISEKIKAMKVGMITSELQLTEEQAIKFWPVYNKYNGEKVELTRGIRALEKSNVSGSQSDILKKQDQIIALKQKELDLVAAYRSEFLNAITPLQYSKMVAAEHKFNQMLLRTLRERRN